MPEEQRGFALSVQHPILRMLASGLNVSVNSDDPSYFGGDLTHNYLSLAEHLDMDARTAIELARNGFRGSFMQAAAQAPFLGELDRLEASLS